MTVEATYVPSPLDDTLPRNPVLRALRIGWSWLRRYPVIPFLVLALMIICAVFAEQLSPHDPLRGNLRAAFKPPIFQEGGTWEYPLGTDHQGRDILSRLIYGARVSTIISTAVILAGGIGGTIIGLIAGYRGGWADQIAMRAVDFTLAMPFLLVALVVVVVFGQSLELIIVLLILFGWDNFARVVRAETLTLRESDYVSYARIQGASQARILFRHILPGVVGSVLVIGSLRVGSLILTESTLSFLGVGVPPDTPAWGIMASDGRQHLSRAWWIATLPGVAIFLVVMGFNFLGDWLRDWFDPRLRQLKVQ